MILAGLIYLVLIAVGVYYKLQWKRPVAQPISEPQINLEGENTSRIGTEFLGTKDSTVNISRKCFYQSYLNTDGLDSSDFFSEFTVVNGDVVGSINYFPAASDLYQGNINGYAFYKNGYLYLETVADGYSEGKTFKNERIFRFSENSKMLEYGSGQSFPIEPSYYGYVDKTNIEYGLEIQEVDCSAYDNQLSNTLISVDRDE